MNVNWRYTLFMVSFMKIKNICTIIIIERCLLLKIHYVGICTKDTIQVEDDTVVDN